MRKRAIIATALHVYRFERQYNPPPGAGAVVGVGDTRALLQELMKPETLAFDVVLLTASGAT